MSTKVHLVKDMVFPVVMYGCESWAIKKSECWRIDAFKLWSWRSLESPLDREEIKSVNPKGNQPWYSLEGLMLKLQYLGHLMWNDSLEKTLMLGKIESRRSRGYRGWDGWMASPTQWTWVWASSWSWWWTGKPGVIQSMRSQRVGYAWAIELNWLWVVGIKIKFMTTPTQNYIKANRIKCPEISYYPERE